MKKVQVVCINSKNNIYLEKVALVKESTGIKLSKSLFDCKRCGLIASGLGSESFYELARDAFTFVMYSEDSHCNSENLDSKNCTAPKNFYADVLLEDCSKNYIDSYRANFYFVKHFVNNPNLPKEKIDFSNPVSYETFEKHDTTVDCTEQDVEMVKIHLNRLVAFKDWEKKPLLEKIISHPFVDFLLQVTGLK